MDILLPFKYINFTKSRWNFEKISIAKNGNFLNKTLVFQKNFVSIFFNANILAALRFSLFFNAEGCTILQTFPGKKIFQKILISVRDIRY